MLEKIHNNNSKEFMQKILLFIDNIFIAAGNAKPEDVNRILTSNLFSIRDAIFSEIVRDNQIDQIKRYLQQEEIKKNQKPNPEEKEEKNLNQETELDKDQ